MATFRSEQEGGRVIKILRLMTVATLTIAIFTFGVAVGRYELFPFTLVHAVYNSFRPASQNIGSLQSKQRSPYYRLQAPLFEAFPGRADTVMLGDSITAFAHWDDIFPGKAIANRGIPGDTIEGIRDRLGAVVQMNPHKVFVMAGINDLIVGSRAEQVFLIYADTVRNLRSAGSQVFVQSTLLPGANYLPVLRAEVRKLNNRLRIFCFFEEVCRFLDLNARLAPDGYLVLTLDGLHLTPAGYATWRDEIAKDISE
jgi:lysophospholipase L1-like esterase